MLAAALETRESELREDFTRILSDLLQGPRASCGLSQRYVPHRSRACAEQYERFCKFNEEYLSGQLKKGDLSYLS